MLFVQAKRHGGSGNLPPTRIVIHGTVSPCRKGQARATAAYFQQVTRPASAHYVVDPGETVQCLTDDTIGYHAPPNARSLGVELCDPQTGSGKRWADADHEAMLVRAAALVRDLAAKYDIPIRRLTPAQLLAGERGICGHVDVTNAWHQTTHVDPGPDFPWTHFLELVNGADDMDLSDKVNNVWVPPRKPGDKATFTDSVDVNEVLRRASRAYWLSVEQRDQIRALIRLVTANQATNAAILAKVQGLDAAGVQDAIATAVDKALADLKVTLTTEADDA